jgi:3-oxoadipate enol-lactonase
MEIEVNGFRMAYSDSGQGRPLLFVHGYPLNRQMWQPQLDGLADVARIITVDLRGHGDSPAIPGPYTMDLFAGDLVAFLDALGITDTVVLCGLSMGGYVAFAFYRSYAARLAGLILTATRAAADSPETRLARDQSAILAREKGVAAIVDGMLPRLLSPWTRAQKPELVILARRIMLNTSIEGVLGDLEGLKNRVDSTPTLAQINLPTLLLPGAEDVIVPLKEAQAMQAGIRGAQLEVIPNAGHLPNLENTPTFNRAVRHFLQELT